MYQLLMGTPISSKIASTESSNRARSKRFAELMARVDHEFLSEWLGWSPKRLDMLTLLRQQQRSRRQDFRTDVGILYESRQATPEAKVQSIAAKILSLAEELERLATGKVGSDLVSEYAELYAAILRMNWSKDVDDVCKRLSTLEQNSSTYLPVSVMAAWYRAVELGYYRKPDARNAFQHVATKYQNMKWWVVEAAREMAKGKGNTPIEMFLFAKQR